MVLSGIRSTFFSQITFSAYKSSGESSTSTCTTRFDETDTTQGNHYHTEDGIFIAPVTGVYMLLGHRSPLSWWYQDPCGLQTYFLVPAEQTPAQQWSYSAPTRSMWGFSSLGPRNTCMALVAHTEFINQRLLECCCTNHNEIN